MPTRGHATDEYDDTYQLTEDLKNVILGFEPMIRWDFIQFAQITRLQLYDSINLPIKGTLILLKANTSIHL